MREDQISDKRKKAESAFLSKRLAALKSSGKDITQDSIAEACGVSQGLVGQWLTGRTNVPDFRLKKLSKLMGFDPFEFRPSYKDMFIGNGSDSIPFDYNSLNPSNKEFINKMAATLLAGQEDC